MRTVHQTDLFRPHVDPDDHFDLASQFALARDGLIDLALVLIDFPPTDEFLRMIGAGDLAGANDPSRRYSRDPDVLAVARLDRWAGTATPIAVGTQVEMVEATDVLLGAGPAERQGVAALLRVVREAEDGVVIHIVGSARDVAFAVNEDPEVFRRNCRGIYLNAGFGEPRPSGDEVEYNVMLNRAAYSAVLAAPCPVFWMPCAQSGAASGPTAEYGTYFDLAQDDILPYLDDDLKAFFVSALARDTSSAWLRDRSLELDAAVAAQHRGMYCIGGFLHAAGRTVTREGRIVPLDTDQPVAFEFVPVDVNVDSDGRTSWVPTSEKSGRWIFKVADPSSYARSMTQALRALLTSGAL